MTHSYTTLREELRIQDEANERLTRRVQELEAEIEQWITERDVRRAAYEEVFAELTAERQLTKLYEAALEEIDGEWCKHVGMKVRVNGRNWCGQCSEWFLPDETNPAREVLAKGKEMRK